MTDLNEYVGVGDLAAPFVRTKKLERAQEQAERIYAHGQVVVAEAPPLTASQREELARLLTSSTTNPPLMRWHLRLYCGDVVEQTAHASHKSVSTAFTRSVACPACGLSPAAIADAEPLGLASED